jgi:hypothetical protein
VHNAYHDDEVSYLAFSSYFSNLGGASTLQRGIVKTMTRGVNLDKSDFSGTNADMCLSTVDEFLLQFRQLSFKPMITFHFAIFEMVITLLIVYCTIAHTADKIWHPFLCI